MIYKNFSEKEILDARGNSHLGEGIKRLVLKIVRCTENYEDDGKLIYQRGKEYKLWIVKYSDTLLGITKWFTAEPKIIDENSLEYKSGPQRTFLMVPLQTFLYAEDDQEKASFYDFEIVNQQGIKEVIRYQLFVDANDGMQYLIKPWSLKKSEVIQFAVAKLGGTLLDYAIRGRFVCNTKERHIIWLLRRRLGKKQYEDLFFDALKQDFISWNPYADDASMTPISSGQAMVHIGRNSVKADKYQFIYVLR